jgi:hypothetical protein
MQHVIVLDFVVLHTTTKRGIYDYKMRSYVPFMIKGDYITTSSKDHVVNATSHISYKHISNYGLP